MPNWALNTLTVNGPKEALAAFHMERLAALKQHDCDTPAHFTFHQTAAVPPELNGTISPTPLKEDEIRALAAENGWDEETLTYRLSKSLTPEQEATNADYLKRFGASNWYDWCIANWSVRNDCCNTQVIEDTEISFMVSFQTIWSPPTKVFFALAKMYPDLVFNADVSFEDGEDTLEYTFKVVDGVVQVRYNVTQMTRLSSDFTPMTADELDLI